MSHTMLGGGYWPSIIHAIQSYRVKCHHGFAKYISNPKSLPQVLPLSFASLVYLEEWFVFLSLIKFRGILPVRFSIKLLCTFAEIFLRFFHAYLKKAYYLWMISRLSSFIGLIDFIDSS